MWCSAAGVGVSALVGSSTGHLRCDRGPPGSGPFLDVGLLTDACPEEGRPSSAAVGVGALVGSSTGHLRCDRGPPDSGPFLDVGVLTDARPEEGRPSSCCCCCRRQSPWRDPLIGPSSLLVDARIVF